MNDEASFANLLTVPEELQDEERYFATGNEFVSLPEFAGGRHKSMNVPHMGLRGLLELRGAEGWPFVEPFAVADDGEIPLPPCAVETRLDREWIPEATWNLPGGASLRFTTVAPPGDKGFALSLEWTGPRPAGLRFGVRGAAGRPTLSIFSSRDLPASVRFSHKKWLSALSCEMRAEGASVGLGFCCDAPFDFLLNGRDVSELEAEAVRFELSVACPETGAAAFFVGVNQECDGAACCAVDLRRRGIAALLRQTRDWLDAHKLAAPEHIAPMLNRNSYFNYFYSQGRAIDTEDRVLLTSRSPRYYVSSAFWSRDALLWSFPAILLIDRPLAAEILELAFTRYVRNAGVHALYIDGSVLYPGFELDEAAAYIIALGNYLYTVRDLTDLSIIKNPAVMDGLFAIEKLVFSKKHPEKYLFETFLLPSDDPTPHPWVTYDNALLWKAFRMLVDIYNAIGKQKRETFFRECASHLHQAILAECVVESPLGGLMFAWSADLNGAHRVYDDVPGSLLLLAPLGFCDAEDPIYRSTVKWIFSKENPNCLHEGAFAGQTCLHVPSHAWILGYCNAIQAGLPPHDDGAPWLDRLLAAPMDNGYACETIDAQTGQARTGAAFATCAGYLAATVAKALK